MKERAKRGAHPGWSVRFSDGSWLGGAHGWFRTIDAFYADIYEDENTAKNYLDSVKSDQMYQDYFADPAEVVPAWQPLCEKLRFDIRMLENACTINPDDIYNMESKLDDTIYSIKEVLEVLQGHKNKLSKE